MITWNPIHPDKHLEWFENLWIFQFRRWLCHDIIVIVFDKAEEIRVICNLFLEFGGIFLRHPSA